MNNAWCTLVVLQQGIVLNLGPVWFPATASHAMFQSLWRRQTLCGDVTSKKNNIPVAKNSTRFYTKVCGMTRLNTQPNTGLAWCGSLWQPSLWRGSLWQPTKQALRVLHSYARRGLYPDANMLTGQANLGSRQNLSMTRSCLASFL